MTGRRKSTELEDRRGSEVMDGSLSRAVGPSQRDGWPRAEDTSCPFPHTLFQQNPEAPETSVSTWGGRQELSQKRPSLRGAASGALSPAGCGAAPRGGPRRRWLSWSGAGTATAPWLPSRAGALGKGLTSGSCNDRSMVLCESRSKGGGLRRRGTAETRLLWLL